MQMNLKNLSEVKKKLKIVLREKEVYDVVLFGSFVKGKSMPKDIDVAIISEKKNFVLKGFHVSILSVSDFFKPLSLVNTLFREGYSLKKNKSFAEVYGFKNKCLFRYELKNLSASKKVRAVKALDGTNETLVVEYENFETPICDYLEKKELPLTLTSEPLEAEGGNDKVYCETDGNIQRIEAVSTSFGGTDGLWKPLTGQLRVE